MSSFSRRALLAGALPLAACGFRPALGTGGAATGLVDRVEIADPADKRAFDFVERLEERLGRASAPTFRLDYEIATEVQGLAITPENATTRYDVNGTVRYRLVDIGSGKAVAEGSVQSFTAYSAAGTPVSTATQRDDAYARLMRLLADQVVIRLVAQSAAAVAAQAGP